MEVENHKKAVQVRKQKSEMSENDRSGHRKKKLSPENKRARSINKSHTADLRFHGASNGKQHKAGKIYFPDDKSGGQKSVSKSPEARRIMGMLTHHRVKIDKETKLLINGSEILTQGGIKGNINKVGIGFGTGRWTSGRRLDLLKEVNVTLQRKEQQRVASMESPKHR